MRLAEGLGAAWYCLDGRRRRRAAENLRVAFGAPEDPRARRTLIAAVFRNLARTPVEQLFAARLLRTAAQIRARVHLAGDVEAFQRRIRSGDAALFVEGHLGNWEVGAHLLAGLGARCAVIVRRIDNPHINRLVHRERAAYGRIITRNGALAETLDALAGGTWAILAADQNAGRKGIFVPFFGLAAATHTTPAWIACSRRVPLFMAACLRRPAGVLRYDLHVAALPLPAGSEPADVASLTRDALRRLEGWIRLDPAQYNWLHRRWKDRPDGEVPGPHLPQYDHHRPPPPATHPTGNAVS